MDNMNETTKLRLTIRKHWTRRMTKEWRTFIWTYIYRPNGWRLKTMLLLLLMMVMMTMFMMTLLQWLQRGNCCNVLQIIRSLATFLLHVLLFIVVLLSYFPRTAPSHPSCNPIHEWTFQLFQLRRFLSLCSYFFSPYSSHFCTPHFSFYFCGSSSYFFYSSFY